MPLVTGIEREDLVVAAKEIRGYFNSTREPLDVRTRIFGEERDLFNHREVLHMYDVKRLIWGVYGVGAAAALYLLGFLCVGLRLEGRAIGPRAARGAVWGAGLTVCVVVLVGLLSVTGFDSLFLFFHEVSFSNDFWMLDPRRDFLVMMFPQGFWFDATMFVAFVTVGLAVLILASAGAVAAHPWLAGAPQGPSRGPTPGVRTLARGAPAGAAAARAAAHARHGAQRAILSRSRRTRTGRWRAWRADRIGRSRRPPARWTAAGRT